VTVVYDSEETYDDALYTYNGDRILVPHSVVELGDLLFNGAGDDDGVQWFVEDLKGWDSAETRSSSSPRREADGVFTATARHGGRSLELVGCAVAPTLDAAYAAKNALLGAVNLRKQLVLLVTEDRARRVVCTRFDEVRLEQRRRILRFSIPLLAADPRKYADVETEVALAVDELGTFTNEGTMETSPTVVVAGEITTPRLVNVTAGEELAFDLDLAAGEELLVDFDSRSATVGGVSVRSALVSGYRWWQLEPGDTDVRLEADAAGAGGAMTVTARSAWI
jgi:hypothetical protein